MSFLPAPARPSCRMPAPYLLLVACAPAPAFSSPRARPLPAPRRALPLPACSSPRARPPACSGEAEHRMPVPCLLLVACAPAPLPAPRGVPAPLPAPGRPSWRVPAPQSTLTRRRRTQPCPTARRRTRSWPATSPGGVAPRRQMLPSRPTNSESTTAAMQGPCSSRVSVQSAAVVGPRFGRETAADVRSGGGRPIPVGSGVRRCAGNGEAPWHGVVHTGQREGSLRERRTGGKREREK
ncbi:hypothetical protein ACQJBY_029230 [Aegilops geniculata]